jgi:preprotein translocase subunit SecY
MIEALRNAFKLPDLRRKILFTLLILIIYRFAAHVPVPGVDRQAMSAIFASSQLLGLLSMLSGGALENFSVMAMGVYPYITASIIMQLLQPIIPQLAELSKEGEAGRNKMNQYTHWLTVPLAMLQAFTQATVLQRSGAISTTEFGLTPEAFLPTLATIIAMTAGTMFALWLGELIDEQGIGNGVSIIIFGGIVTDIPRNLQALLAGSISGLVALLIISVITVAVIVLIQEGQRRIRVQYGKRVRGMKVYGGQETYIPLRVNSAGMIPLIFASSMLILPGVVASYFQYNSNQVVASIAKDIFDIFNRQSDIYWVLYFVMVVLFTYFYTDVIFREQNLPETLQRQGGFIPGIRPGKNTADYLNNVLSRITLVGAVFLGLVAILPWFARSVLQVQTMLITSTGILIVVGVVLDTMKQLEAQLLMRHYEGFIR